MAKGVREQRASGDCGKCANGAGVPTHLIRSSQFLIPVIDEHSFPTRGLKEMGLIQQKMNASNTAH
jgi:hypothetical protein